MVAHGHDYRAGCRPLGIAAERLLCLAHGGPRMKWIQVLFAPVGPQFCRLLTVIRTGLSASGGLDSRSRFFAESLRRPCAS